jgi:hypothetical protein
VALFDAGATCRRCLPVMAPRSIVPGIVGDTGPLAWPAMTMGCVKACPFPSGVRSLTPCSSFCIYGGRRQCRPPTRPMPQSESNHAPLGSGGAELPFLGLGEARPIPLGSGEVQPPPKGLNEQNLCPRGRVNWNLSLGVG